MQNHETAAAEISLEQLVISHSYEMLALITVLERKGILSRQELVAVIQDLQRSGSGESQG